MKRIYIAILLLTASLVLAAAETGYVSAKADTYISRIDAIDKQMRKDNFAEAADLCKELEESWEKSAKRVDMLLIHDYVDSIGEEFSRMRSYTENASVDMYFSESTSAKKELASIRESEYPYFANIL